MRTLAALLLLAAPLRAQPPDAPAALRGDNPATAKRLRDLAARLAAGPNADALAEASAILQASGDDWVPAGDGRLRPARAAVQAALAALPADALAPFRLRADPAGRELFEAGRDRRDPALLRRCVDRTFPSRPSLDALELLGELAANRGDYGDAVRHWGRLLPPNADPNGEPASADYAGDRASLLARLTLAQHRAGRAADAAASLARLRTQHPGANGALAGETGEYAAILERRLSSPPPAPVEAPSSAFPTFAGDAERSGRATSPPPEFWPTTPTWRTRLPADRPDRLADPARSRPVSAAPAHCAFHPVIVGGRAYVADAARVIGFDGRTGAASVAYDVRDEPEAAAWRRSIDVAVPAPAGADFTLAADGATLFARLGVPAVGAPRGAADEPRGPTSFLVGIDVSGPAPRRLWALPPPADAAGAFAQWEGAPLAAGGRLYAAFTRADGNRVTQGIACYDEPPGAPLWLRDLWDDPAPVPAEPRLRHELLTLAGENVVFAPGGGVVAALGRDDGRPAWAFRYPRTRPAPPAAGRDLAPPCHAAGRVVVAPPDSDTLYCLDAATGAPRWRAGPQQVEQVLGVAGGRVVVTTLEPSRGVRAYDLATGDASDPAGWRQFAGGLLRSFGRGLLTRDLVVWPVRDPVGALLLDAATGHRAAAFSLTDAHGNLAYADNLLVVATPTEVRGYVGTARYVPDKSPDFVQSRADWRFPTPRAIPGDSERDSEETFGPWKPVEVVGAATFADPAARPLEPFRGRFLLHAPTPMPGNESTLPPPARRFLFADRAHLHAVKFGAEAPAWSAPLPPWLTPTHAAVAGEIVLVGGADGLWGVRLRDGSPLWGLPAPMWDDLAPAGAPRPRAAGRGPPGPGFSDFALVGGRPVVRLGDRAFAGVDPRTGAPAWRLTADGAPPGPALPGAPRFGREWAAVSPRLFVVQLDGGARWAVDAATGEVRDRSPGAPGPWSTPPSGRDGPSLAACADGSTGIVAFTPESGHRRWATEARNVSGLTGAPPQVALGRAAAVGVNARNSGAELLRIDAENGRLTDPPRVLWGADADLGAAVETDAGAVVPASGPNGWFLANAGPTPWVAPLPCPGPWLLRRGDGCVWAAPAAPPADDSPDDVFARLVKRASLLDVRRAPLLGWGLYDGWVGRRAPLLALDPATGRVLQRLELPAGPLLRLHAAPGAVVAATAGRAYWLR